MELHHQAATPDFGTASGTLAAILRDVLSGALEVGSLLSAAIAVAVIFVDRRTVAGCELRMRGKNLPLMGKTRVATRERPRPGRGPRRPQSAASRNVCIRSSFRGKRSSLAQPLGCVRF